MILFYSELESSKRYDQIMILDIISDSFIKEHTEYFFFKLILIVYHPEMYKKINMVIHLLGNNKPKYYLLSAIVTFNNLYNEIKTSKEKLYIDMLNLYKKYINTGDIEPIKLKLYKNTNIVDIFQYFERELIWYNTFRTNNNSSINKQNV